MEGKQTQITFNKTSCYFCNDWLENDSFKDHILHCGQVLEKCPNACLAYIQRKEMNKHLNECPKSKISVVVSSLNGLSNIDEIDKKLLILEQDINSLRSILNEEIRQRLRIIIDVGSLKKKYLVTDEWTNKVSDVLNALKKCINEETKSRCIDMEKCKGDLDKIIIDLQQLENSRDEISVRIDQIQNFILQENNVREHLDILINDNGVHIAKINRLEAEIEEFKFELSESTLERDKDTIDLTGKLLAISLSLDGQNKDIKNITDDLNTTINNFTSEFEGKTILLEECASKQMTMDYEVKSIKHIVHETEDKCEKLEKIVRDVQLKVSETQQNLNDLQMHLKSQNLLLPIHNMKGQLIWKIENYTEKMKEAKETDQTIRSPIFCNKQYGYTLRLDVNLNGIGTWKGRNLIACLTVISGDYDTLLRWPCKLEADIVLRDQPDDIGDAKNCYKTIVVKKKQDKFEQNQYIHIPHKTIESQNFIKNDSIILEVRVHSRK